MDIRIGEVFNSMQFDMGECRDIEILFIYKEKTDAPQMDVILYRYPSALQKGSYIYRTRRRLEVEADIKKAAEEKEYSDENQKYYEKNRNK